MSIASPEEPTAPRQGFIPTRLRWALLLGSLAVMLLFLGRPTVMRTQEARVLETAREMMGADARGWLIPRLNGLLRLEKPPMAYWLSAVSYYVGGVSEGVGRVPFAIAGWATLIVTFATGRWLFGPRVGYLAAGVLMAGLLFGRNGRFAETDVLATLFVTTAIYCIWRGAEDSARAGHLFRLSGLMMGLAVFAKGMPAAFIVIFLIALAASRRDARLLWRWTKSGAPLLAILIGGAWFAYVHATVGLDVIRSEAETGLVGRQHTGSAFGYVPDLLRAAAPWSALTVFALVVAAYHWRDWRFRGALVWVGAIAVPLCLAGQKQFHYLFPLMPVLAIITGWLLNEATRERFEHVRAVRVIFYITVGVLLAAMVMSPVAGYMVRGRVVLADFVASAAGIAIGLVALRQLRGSYERGVIATVGGVAVAMSVLVQLWIPTLEGVGSDDVAASIRNAGPGPYYFYGPNLSLPLVFYMRTVMPQLETPEELAAEAIKQPSLLAVVRTKSGGEPPSLPDGFEQALDIDTKDGEFRVFRHATAK
jgi:4-amino-4-deoxy-L-arabinose transferase-like glycosyltransferase